MTDGGRRARWSSVLVVAPVAAAAFAAATTWVAGHPPAPVAGGAPAPAPVPVAAPAGTSPRAQQALDREAARVAVLERRVAALRAQLGALLTRNGATGAGTSVAAAASGSGRGGGRAPSAAGAGRRATSGVSTPPVQHVAVAAPRPPAVHVVTGGS